MTIISGQLQTIVTPHRLTLEEYLIYDDGTDTRYELVDGVLVEMGAESTINTLIAGFLFSLFLSVVPAYQIGFKQKIQVNSAYSTARDPDLGIHTETSFQAINGLSEACLKLTDPNPLLVIEVVSPGDESSKNYQRDYVQKPQEYAARGIREYWIVDPDRAIIKVGRLMGDTYQFQDFTGHDLIASSTVAIDNVTAAQILNAGR